MDRSVHCVWYTNVAWKDNFWNRKCLLVKYAFVRLSLHRRWILFPNVWEIYSIFFSICCCWWRGFVEDIGKISFIKLNLPRFTRSWRTHPIHYRKMGLLWTNNIMFFVSKMSLLLREASFVTFGYSLETEK